MWWWLPHAQYIAASSWPRWCGSRRWTCVRRLPRPRRNASIRPRPRSPSLFPLEVAWAVTLPAVPARPAVRDGVRVIVPLSSGNARRARLGERRHGLVGAACARRPRPWPPTDSCTSARAIPCTRSTPPPAPRHWTSHAGGTLHGTGASPTARRSGWAPASRTPSTPHRVAGTVGPRAPAGRRCDRARRRRRRRCLPPTATVASSRSRSPTAASSGRGRSTAARAPRCCSSDSLFVGTTDKQLLFARRRQRQGAMDVAHRRRRHRRRGAGAKAVYYTSLDAVVRAVNPGNGHQRWKRDVGTRAPVGPIALDGTVLVTGLSPYCRRSSRSRARRSGTSRCLARSPARRS